MRRYGPFCVLFLCIVFVVITLVLRRAGTGDNRGRPGHPTSNRVTDADKMAHPVVPQHRAEQSTATHVKPGVSYRVGSGQDPTLWPIEDLSELSLPQLAARLRTHRGEAGLALIRELASRGPQSVPHLLPLLSDPSWKVRQWTAGALELMGHVGIVKEMPLKTQKEIQVALKPLLKDSDIRVRAAAAEAYAKCGGSHQAAADSLRSIIAEDTNTGYSATQDFAIVKTQCLAHEFAVPLWLEVLHDESITVRGAAAWYLGNAYCDSPHLFPSDWKERVRTSLREFLIHKEKIPRHAELIFTEMAVRSGTAEDAVLALPWLGDERYGRRDDAIAIAARGDQEEVLTALQQRLPKESEAVLREKLKAAIAAVESRIRQKAKRTPPPTPAQTKKRGQTTK